ncbi:MAG TPA: phage holin family protein [Candidatus Binatia bacterium]|nr:phage holin family protein [Candidatus Binatia bacterium]
MNWLLRFLINALVFYCIGKFVPGFYHNVSVWNAIIAAIVFGVVNMLIGPILRLISLPLTWITHGLFALVINYLLFVITVRLIHFYDPSSGVNPWLADLYGALIMTVVSVLVAMGASQEASRA